MRPRSFSACAASSRPSWLLLGLLGSFSAACLPSRPARLPSRPASRRLRPAAIAAAARSAMASVASPRLDVLTGSAPRSRDPDERSRTGVAGCDRRRHRRCLLRRRRLRWSRVGSDGSGVAVVPADGLAARPCADATCARGCTGDEATSTAWSTNRGSTRLTTPEGAGQRRRAPAASGLHRRSGAETTGAGPRGSCTAMPTARIPAAVAERGKTAAARCRNIKGIVWIVSRAEDVSRP